MVASFAVAALKAGHMMGNKNAVANFERFDFCADFVDDACSFVPKHYWRFGNTVPFDDVAAADAACHHLKQRFVFADLWDGHFFDSDVMVIVVDCGKQKYSPKKRLVRLCQL